ncbi:UvrD-helicase domain-containing protein [bacterium]|nr:UvrD-helicase domain-containing protein [bacterium]
MSSPGLWRDLEQELNPRQREAVFAPDPHILVMAGPGTGKTRTLVNRIVYLGSVSGVDASSILALTFTRKAASVMVDRLAGYLGERAGQVAAGTFHHFGIHLLREHAERANLPPDFAVADEGRQLAVLRRAWQKLDFSSREPEDKELRLLLGRFGIFRVDQDSKLLSGLQQDLFKEYQALLRSEKAVDFDDILDLTRKLLGENSDLQAQVRERWAHVLVDEFQDTDALQYRILRHLVPKESHSFLVADANQSIYAWRGADPRNLADYRRDYEPREIFLEENYRNRARILDGAKALLGGEKVSAKSLQSRAGGEGQLRVESFDSEEDEAAFLGADIRQVRLRDRDLHWRDVAILYPKHSIGEYLEGRLMGERIPVEMISGRGLLDQPRILQILATLRLLRNPADDDAMGRVLRAHLDPGSTSLMRELVRRNDGSWRQALNALRRHRDALRGQSRQWRSFQESTTGKPDDQWMEDFEKSFPEGLNALSAIVPVEKEAASRGEWEAAGERLSLLARLSWKMDERIARLSNLRAGQKGKTLRQLVGEVLLEIEEDTESELPGDPFKAEGLEELLDELRSLLRRGKRVSLSASEQKQEQIYLDWLGQTLEPWYRNNLVPGGAEPPEGPRLRLEAESHAIILEGGERRHRVEGEIAPLLFFRLYQLWRAAEYQPLRDYVIFDLETTGIDTSRCEILEIGAIRYEGGREVARFETLVKPSGLVPAESTAIHGIDDAMLEKAPAPAQAIADFLRFVGDLDLVAHNGSSFDFPVLVRVARELGFARPRQALYDSLALARRLFPRERNRLEDLIERFGISAEARHRALDDCRCLGEAFDQMQSLQLKRLARRSGRDGLAPLAMVMQLDPAGPPSRSEDTAHALFAMGVRRLLASGSPWLEKLTGGSARKDLESALLAASGLEGEAPELFRGRSSEEERFLALLPRFDELFLGDSLASFLDFLALYRSQDSAEGQDAVQLMTIHAAKGLEFDQVYIAGLEENVLPGYYALRSPDPEAVEEERRLLYVAMTRAGKSLTLTRVSSRGGFVQEASRFLSSLVLDESEKPS